MRTKKCPCSEEFRHAFVDMLSSGGVVAAVTVDRMWLSGIRRSGLVGVAVYLWFPFATIHNIRRSLDISNQRQHGESLNYGLSSLCTELGLKLFIDKGSCTEMQKEGYSPSYVRGNAE